MARFPQIIAAALAFVAFATPSAAQQGAPFVERFETVDEGRWIIADGWSNGPNFSNDWRRSQIEHQPGRLDIVLARRSGGLAPYASSELQGRDYYDSGYFEVRMRVPRGSGLVTGFFTYAQPDGPETWDEIDIEILGRNTRAIQFTYHHRGRQHIVTLPLPFDAADDFHTYGIEWTSNAIRWYVDGRLVHAETGVNGPLSRGSQRLYLNLWNSKSMTGWLGPVFPWGGPWRLSVTCIAYAPDYHGRRICPGEDD